MLSNMEVQQMNNKNNNSYLNEQELIKCLAEILVTRYINERNL